ncbi:hypothetical protein [Streptomyces sp. NPDC001380]|uniref:hypothetical protein n=1 Tax=Streptomyces sp. NPDC001380 TaxID=3364566 RepID=UPI0036BDA091
MGDGVLNVVLGVVASLVSAGLGWLAQTLRRRRRLARVREFLGMAEGTECLLVVPRHAKLPDGAAVALPDAYALMELAALIRECGAHAHIASHDRVQQGVGAKAEVCLGGPSVNSRTAAHLAWRFPGLRVGEWTGPGSPMPITAGEHSFSRVPDQAEYAVLARIPGSDSRRPVFLVCGQTSVSNQAAVRYLMAHRRRLMRAYGAGKPFCLVVRAVNTPAYGPDVVELAADVTREAVTPPPPPAPTGEPAAGTAGAASS